MSRSDSGSGGPPERGGQPLDVPRGGDRWDDRGVVLEVDGLEFEPVPSSWLRHGTDASPVDRAPSRHYATLAAVDADDIVVRYVHPGNDPVVVRRGSATRSESGSVVPAALVDSLERWPRSTTIPFGDLFIKDNLPEATVREVERRILADRWDWSETRYRGEEPSDQARADR